MRWPRRVTPELAFRIAQFVVGATGFFYLLATSGPTDHPIALALSGILMGIPVVWPSGPMFGGRDERQRRDRRPWEDDDRWDEERERRRARTSRDQDEDRR